MALWSWAATKKTWRTLPGWRRAGSRVCGWGPVPRGRDDRRGVVSLSANAISDAFMSCGGCRQVLWKPNAVSRAMRVLLQVRDEDVMISESAINLMPFAFEAKGLGVLNQASDGD